MLNGGAVAGSADVPTVEYLQAVLGEELRRTVETQEERDQARGEVERLRARLEAASLENALLRTLAAGDILPLGEGVVVALPRDPALADILLAALADEVKLEEDLERCGTLATFELDPLPRGLA